MYHGPLFAGGSCSSNSSSRTDTSGVDMPEQSGRQIDAFLEEIKNKQESKGSSSSRDRGPPEDSLAPFNKVVMMINLLLPWMDGEGGRIMIMMLSPPQKTTSTKD